MSATPADHDHQCMQLYRQPFMDGMAQQVPSTEGFSDATVVTTSPTIMTMSSEGILSPKSNAFKPIRRRSRASKGTPATLLNANTTNFRALVQQFTGCHTTSMSFPIHIKGPITLNFQQGGHHTSTRAIMPPFGSNQGHQVAVPAVPPQLIPKQQLMPEHQRGYSLELDHVKSSNFLPTSGIEVSHGLPMNNDLSLHELTVNDFSNVLCDENFYQGFNYAIDP